MINLYLVQDGEASLCAIGTEMDGNNSVLVLAETEDEALTLARKYDACLIDIDNHMYAGRQIVAVKDESP